jgi:hypothetical protein
VPQDSSRWKWAGCDLTFCDTEWSVWFRVTVDRGEAVLVVATIRTNGEVAGFEVHSGDERQMPLEREDTRQIVRPRVEQKPVALTAPMMRQIPFGQLANAAREWGSKVSLLTLLDPPVGLAALHRFDDEPDEPAPEGFELTLDTHDPKVVEMIQRARTMDSNPRRRSRPDRYFASIAVAYEQWLPTGQPLRALAARLDIPLATLRWQVQEARRRGLLTGGRGKGRKGGRATDEARRLLDEEDNDDGEH